jgi:hypothetical protein
VSPALQSIRRMNPRGKKPNKTQQKERLDWRQPIQTARSMPAATSRARSSPRLTHACTSAAKLNRRTAEPVFGGTNEAAIVSTAVALDGGQAGPHLLVGSSRSGQLSFSTTTSGPGVSGIGVLISCAPRVSLRHPPKQQTGDIIICSCVRKSKLHTRTHSQYVWRTNFSL